MKNLKIVQLILFFVFLSSNLCFCMQPAELRRRSGTQQQESSLVDWQNLVLNGICLRNKKELDQEDKFLVSRKVVAGFCSKMLALTHDYKQRIDEVINILFESLKITNNELQRKFDGWLLEFLQNSLRSCAELQLQQVDVVKKIIKITLARFCAENISQMPHLQRFYVGSEYPYFADLPTDFINLVLIEHFKRKHLELRQYYKDESSCFGMRPTFVHLSIKESGEIVKRGDVLKKKA